LAEGKAYQILTYSIDEDHHGGKLEVRNLSNGTTHEWELKC
jgi:hypothetical protein